MDYVNAALLESSLDGIRQSPTNGGRIELIVRRPARDEREVVQEATLDCAKGLIGATTGRRDRRTLIPN
jgi:hypothetical protein